MKRAFTLLELLLVIAIIAVLSSIIYMSLRPAENIKSANDAKGFANSTHIEKALATYVLDNGSLPASFDSLGAGVYDICNQDVNDVSCVVLSDYLVPGYLATLPQDPNGSDSIVSGFKINFNPVGDKVNIYNDTEYKALLLPEDWWSSDYSYRTPVTITNNDASAWTDYQVLLSINTQSYINASKLKSDCSDLRFSDELGNQELGYWIESGCNTSSTLIWVKVPTLSIGANTIHMYYGYASAAVGSSIENTFIASSITHFFGDCSDSNYCHYIDVHSDGDYIKQNFPISSMNQVTAISDFGGADYFFRRYRFLFKANESGSYMIATNSDDGSDISHFPGDGYGGGYNTAHPYGAHTVIANFYGGHATGTCGVSGVPGSFSMTVGQGYWLDYIMEEWTGGQGAQACVRKPSSGSYQTLSTANFPGQLFARKYMSSSEPTSSIGVEEEI